MNTIDARHGKMVEHLIRYDSIFKIIIRRKFEEKRGRAITWIKLEDYVEDTSPTRA